jgi:hypothetical protein
MAATLESKYRVNKKILMKFGKVLTVFRSLIRRPCLVSGNFVPNNLNLRKIIKSQ